MTRFSNLTLMLQELTEPVTPSAADEAFSDFRIGFSYRMCRAVEGEMVYSFRSSTGISRAKELAENIIKEKNLPLIVIQSNFLGEKLIIKYVDGISACKRIMQSDKTIY